LPLKWRLLLIAAASLMFLGVANPVRAQSADELTAEAAKLHQAGRYVDAAPLYERALGLNEQALGADHPKTAGSLNDLGTVNLMLGRFEQAQPMLERALAVREQALGPEHPDTAATLANLATLHRTQGRYPQALSMYQRALSISEKVRDPDHVDIAQAANNLAGLYRAMGRYSQALPLYQRALAITEKSLGPDHPYTATAMNNLAANYGSQGQYALALPLMERALAMREKIHGPEHPQTANSLNNLASVRYSLGEYARAIPLHERALAINERALGPENPEAAPNLHNLATAHRELGQYDQALPLMQRALALREKALGTEHPAAAETRYNLARIYRLQGQSTLAREQLQRALAIFEKGLGPEHPNTAKTLEALAALHWAPGGAGPGEAMSRDDALATIRRATAIHKERATAAGLENTERARSGVRSELLAARSGFVTHVRLLGAGETPRDPDIAEAFEVAQLARASDTASAVAQMAARFATRDDELAALIRSRQDLALRLRFLDGELLRALSRSGQARDAGAAARIRRQIGDVEGQLTALSATLDSRFPDYQVLTGSAPLAMTDAQRLLGPKEALLSYLTGDEESYLWVVTADRGRMVRLPIGRRELDDAVRALRGSLDASLTGGRVVPFPAAQAHALYMKAMAPAIPLLTGITHLLVVPDGALQSLPLAVLIAEPPAPQETYRDMKWLAGRYAFSTLPSESSLKALRRFAGGRSAPDPFVGFGDPAFKGAPGSTRQLSALYQSRGLADVEQLSQLAPLPESATEIAAIATALGAPLTSIFLGEAATESQVKRLDLARYRTLAFATHAFVAGQIDGIVEPALALTPPTVPTEQDDGLLTASEIARLKLSADWVILSACNTAAPDGLPSAEGLSGLARAFIFAGSRSLLVSHWPVDSRAAAQLTTRMIEESGKSAVARHEALRRSMLALMQSRGFDHPIYWSPFVLVGA
jgi:CHAT domain-containing protein/Tfp pilus assembly protein PilF